MDMDDIFQYFSSILTINKDFPNRSFESPEI